MASTKKKRVLFLCTGNACRSQMAEGLVNHDFAQQLEACSAGTEPHGLNPTAVTVLAELGIDIAANTSDHISNYEGQTFDYVITLCGDADKNCPQFFGGVKRRHMGFDDPGKTTGSPEEIMASFRQVRDQIRQQLGTYFRQQLC